MSETTTTDEPRGDGLAPSEHPFEETEGGRVRVTQPLLGVVPSEMTLTFDGTTYRLSAYRGKDVESRFEPAVLLYDEITVVEESDQPYGVTD